MTLPVFGATPKGDRLARIKGSPNWRNGQFDYPERTLQLAPGTSMLKLLGKFLVKPSYTRPAGPLPAVKTDLLSLDDAGQPVVVWFGHSSYLVSYRGKKILVDPVFSGYASPFSFVGATAFAGTDVYQAADFGFVDILLLTHDHYDHLDYHVVQQLRGNVGRVVTSLGVGAHLERWGVHADLIHELDWWETAETADVRITAAPGRHFSGRSIKRNQTLWGAFVLELGDFRLFIGGDSGYGSHFKTIGERFGTFDLAFIETGQYNEHWPQIHMLPAEWPSACADLGARAVMPVHWGKFALAMHAWNEPPRMCRLQFAEHTTKLVMPMIGQPVRAGIDFPTDQWWEMSDAT